MVELDWRVDARAGVALVELTVANPDPSARRVRVANRLDGPVWPPRREGVPAAGWDDGGFEGVVGAGRRRALGYASPAPGPPAEPPAEVVWTERAGDAASTDAGAVEATPAGVVRDLGDGRPPADAVPRPAPDPEPPIPDAVETWLAGFEDKTALTDAERDALRAVASRARELREGSR